MNTYCSGMDHLLDAHAKLLRGGRVGLVSHPASINRLNCPSHVLLRDLLGEGLVSLFGPEHGFYGVAGPGESVENGRHPAWNIPIHSLYGHTRVGLEDTLRDLDVLVFDLQDLGVRCYTYVSTLRQILEAAARTGTRVVVADRPIPHAHRVDGPMRAPDFDSFVSAIPAPLVYAMTPGETAQWLKSTGQLDVDLSVIPCKGFARPLGQDAVWSEWVPPSPAIRSLNIARCYPATVFTEAFPSLDCARQSRAAFCVLRASWFQVENVLNALRFMNLPGVIFSSWHGIDQPDQPGFLMHITDASAFRPALTGMAILQSIQHVHGDDHLWGDSNARQEFFDKLMGGPQTREQLRAGTSLQDMSNQWHTDSAVYSEEREQFLMY